MGIRSILQPLLVFWNSEEIDPLFAFRYLCAYEQKKSNPKRRLRTLTIGVTNSTKKFGNFNNDG